MSVETARSELYRLLGPPPQGLAATLAPSGALRAGINMSNHLLVSARDSEGGPAGISPDMAAALAAHLGLTFERVPYDNPGKLADAAIRDEWDVGLIGAEPQRAETIAFTSAYCEIEATCIVREGSPIRCNAEIDSLGRTIALAPRTAWGLWLDRNIREAMLVKADTYVEARTLFLDRGLDALGGLRPQLIEDVKAMPGARLLEGRFMAVQQAIGTPRAKEAALTYLQSFSSAAVASGFVAALIAKHRVQGLSVAVSSA